MYDIVLVTKGNVEFTKRCLKSIFEHGNDCRVIWVDNGSSKIDVMDVLLCLQQYNLPYIEIILPENIGFVKGSNVGLAASTADYVVLLNNDTQIFPKTFEVLKAACDRGAGLAGPVSTSGWQHWQRCVPVEIPKEAQREQEGIAAWLYDKFRDEVHNCEMLAFFCVMIRRDVIRKLGYLSEEFDVGFGDDDDYCYRAAAAGYPVRLALGAYCWHNHRTTFNSEFPGQWQAMQEVNIKRLREKWEKQ